MKRPLLVEFAATDRFHRAVAYPYMLGRARRAGMDARWFRVGVPAAVRFERSEHGVGLPTDEIEVLAASAASFRPDVVFFDRWPSPPIATALRAVLPDTQLAVRGEAGQAPQGIEPSLVSIDRDDNVWTGLLGLEPETAAAWKPWDETPDFGYESINAAARSMQPLPFVVLGSECSYDRSLDNNPFFAGVDLERCVRDGGCAFCPRGPNPKHTPRANAEKVRVQLAALRRTLPHFSGRLAIRLLGEPALSLLDEIIDALVDGQFAPCDLLLDTRADRLVRCEERLTAAAARLTGTGHRLHIALVGIENFARDELLRMNKGTTPYTNLDAILTLLRLESRHPESFAFREHGGLSMILFTPWSSLEDVVFNLRLASVCGLHPIAGKLLTSRLRLEPGLPITAAAARDDLLIARYADDALDTAARNLYGGELPWRFADPRLETVCRLLVRLGADAANRKNDPLCAEVARIRDEAAMRAVGAFELALAIAEEATLQSSDAADLLARAWRSLDDGRSAYGGSQKEQSVRAERATQVSSHDKETPRLEHLVNLSREGIKPVSKIEPVPLTERERWLADPALPSVKARDRKAGDACEVFFGVSPERVQRAIDFAQACESAANADTEAQAIMGIGGELGYPACCARHFAVHVASAERADYCWQILERRLATPGPVPPELNPCARTVIANYVPCSASCEASLRLVRRELELGRSLYGEEWFAARRHEAENPWLVVLRGQMCALELVAQSPVGEWFRFRPGLRSADIPELALASRANEMVIDAERLVLLRNGTLVADYSALAFLWWHGRAFQVSLWRRVLEIRARQPAVSAPVDLGSAAAPMSPEVVEVAHRLRSALLWMGERGRLPKRMQSDGPHPFDSGSLWLRLSVDTETVRLIVKPTRPGQRYFFEVGSMQFSYRNDEPVERRQQHDIVRSFAAALGQALVHVDP